jgi:hypothetical protein
MGEDNRSYIHPLIYSSAHIFIRSNTPAQTSYKSLSTTNVFESIAQLIPANKYEGASPNKPEAPRNKLHITLRPALRRCGDLLCGVRTLPFLAPRSRIKFNLPKPPSAFLSHLSAEFLHPLDFCVSAQDARSTTRAGSFLFYTPSSSSDQASTMPCLFWGIGAIGHKYIMFSPS